MASSGVEKKHEIDVTVRKVGGQYVSAPIDRLRETQGNNLTWNFHNETGDTIEVKLQRFVGATAPADDARDTIGAGTTAKIKVKAKDRETDVFTYEIVVTNTANPTESNTIDPELQIDGKRRGSALLVLGAAVAGAAAGAAVTFALTP